MHPTDYLSQLHLPNDVSWLDHLNTEAVDGNESEFPWESFWGSRLVYYPGAGDDGGAVKTFSPALASRCFVHADYRDSVDAVRYRLTQPQFKGPGAPFKGYGLVASFDCRLDHDDNELWPGLDKWLEEHRPELDSILDFGGPAEVVSVFLAHTRRRKMNREAASDDLRSSPRLKNRILQLSGRPPHIFAQGRNT